MISLRKYEANVFSEKSLDKLISSLQIYRDELSRCMDDVIEEVGEIGKDTAEQAYAETPFAGEKDYHLEVESDGDGKGALVATGAGLSFLEFGTGIEMGQGPTLPRPEGWDLGSYGLGHGAHPPWIYRGKKPKQPPAGTTVSKKHPGSVMTHGGPPANALGKALDKMKEETPDILRKVVRRIG